MNKDNERITYEEFITMFKIAPRMCYTLYEKAEDEIDKLKKQKADVVELIKKTPFLYSPFKQEVLRMLGEIDNE